MSRRIRTPGDVDRATQTLYNAAGSSRVDGQFDRVEGERRVFERLPNGVVSLLLAAAAFGCSTSAPPPTPVPNHRPASTTDVKNASPFAQPLDALAPPPAPREFRAAWVATVNNTDWPSRRGLSSIEQRREIVAICDRAAQLKLNCLIVQVRPSADAIYPSTLEPWSVFLTGTPGQAPVPFYDPLQTWIDECHRRGIELHAWLNPFRVRVDNDESLAANSLARRYPDIVKTYGDKLWLDPGEPLSARLSLAVFNDVVRRYDVDGIHIDDYFYPYPQDDPRTKKAIPFPDDASWNRYKRDHPVKPNPTTKPADVEMVARAEWRRQNVNRFVEELNRTTKQIKPWVKFGISPFGIGRSGKVPDIRGFDQYDGLYADVALWLNNGWCDYLSPQLYWPIAPKAQSFPALLRYWESENTMKRHLWPGLATYQAIAHKKGYTAFEIEQQIAITRQLADAGHVHFSFKNLMGNEVAPALQADLYQADALVPASPWLDNVPPPAPAVASLVNGMLTLAPGRGEPTWEWAIWKRRGGKWTFQTAPGASRAITIDPTTTDVVVSAIDRCGNESVRIAAR